MGLIFIDIFLLTVILIYTKLLKRESSLPDLTQKTVLILFGFLILFSISNYFIYSNLNNKEYSIISKYEYSLEKKDYITFGTQRSHIPFFNKNEMVEGRIIKTEKGWELQNLEKIVKKKSKTIKLPYFFLYSKKFKKKELPAVIENGDYLSIRKIIGSHVRNTSIYRIYLNDKRIIFKPIFAPRSIPEFWKVYTASELRIVDLAKLKQIENITKDNKDLKVNTVDIRLLGVIVELIYISTFILFSILIIQFFKGKLLKDYRFIFYPIFPLVAMVMFAYFSSFINFTYLQFYYPYSKTGTLFIYTLISIFMLFNIFVFYILIPVFKKKFYIFLVAFFLFAILPIYVLFKTFLFGANFEFIKSLPFIIESIVFFTLIPISSLFLHINFNKLIFNKFYFSSKFKNYLTYFSIFAFIFAIIVIGAISIGILKEGRGISIIEIAKVLIILIVLFAFLSSSKLAIIKNKFNLFFYIFLGLLLFASLIMMKDYGNILQYGITFIIITFLLLNIFDKNYLKLILKSKKFIFFISLFSIVLIYFFYSFTSNEILNKIRFALWLNPFDFIGYGGTEQILFGILSLKFASFLPKDLNSIYILNIPEVHTDYIFTVFTNIFGFLGGFLLIIAFFFLPLTLFPALKRYEKYYKNKEVIEFLFMLNITMISYFLSYIIVNVSAVLQLLPLTDVPLVFITYSRILLVVFFIIVIYLIWINISYVRILGGK